MIGQNGTFFFFSKPGIVRDTEDISSPVEQKQFF